MATKRAGLKGASRRARPSNVIPLDGQAMRRVGGGLGIGTGAKTTTTEDGTISFWLVPADTAPTRPTAPLYLALFSASPGESGAVTNELVTADGYARQAITFSTPAGTGATANTNAMSFGPASANWPSATHWGICRSGTRGTSDVLYYAALGTPRTIGINQSASVAAGAITVAEG